MAVASTVATTHFHALVAHGHPATAALTGGFQWALWVCGITGLAAVPAALALIRHKEITQPVPATTTPTPGPTAVTVAVGA